MEESRSVLAGAPAAGMFSLRGFECVSQVLKNKEMLSELRLGAIKEVDGWIMLQFLLFLGPSLSLSLFAVAERTVAQLYNCTKFTTL